MFNSVVSALKVNLNLKSSKSKLGGRVEGLRQKKEKGIGVVVVSSPIYIIYVIYTAALHNSLLTKKKNICVAIHHTKTFKNFLFKFSLYI
jgi:hypothetical protein